MCYRSRWLLLGPTALLGLVSPALGQSFRQVSLNTSTGQIDRRYLPSSDTFDFLVRAASELREFRGEYRNADGTGPTLPDPWVRRDGTKSKDATLRIKGLSPGATYQFTFVLVRRPSGNEGRLIEAGVLNALRDAFRAHPGEPIEVAVAAAAPGVKAALEAVLPRAVPAPGSPLTGDPSALLAALETRGVDVLHSDYLRELGLVGSLGSEFSTARRSLVRSAILRRALDAIDAGMYRDGFAELGPPLDACRRVRDPTVFSTTDSIETDLNQLALLAALKAYDAAMGSCGGLLRDVRLPRYKSVRPDNAAGAADLMIPVANRLEALRSETERLVALWRKRENSLSQVATDVRRTLDTGVTVSDSLEASFGTEPSVAVPPKTTLGLALAGTLAPCSLTASCVRIVPAVALSFQLRGLLGAEVGLTLADTDAPGRTRHLFWSVGGMTGLTMRLGATRPQRVGIGALILRQAEGNNFDSFRLGGYFSFTVYDFRL